MESCLCKSWWLTSWFSQPLVAGHTVACLASRWPLQGYRLAFFDYWLPCACTFVYKSTYITALSPTAHLFFLLFTPLSHNFFLPPSLPPLACQSSGISVKDMRGDCSWRRGNDMGNGRGHTGTCQGKSRVARARKLIIHEAELQCFSPSWSLIRITVFPFKSESSVFAASLISDF